MKKLHLLMDVSGESSSSKCLYTWPLTLELSMRMAAILCFSRGTGGVRKSWFSRRLWPGLSDRELLLEDDIVMSSRCLLCGKNTVNSNLSRTYITVAVM